MISKKTLIKEKICKLQGLIGPLFLDSNTESERYFDKLSCLYYSLLGNSF